MDQDLDPTQFAKQACSVLCRLASEARDARAWWRATSRADLSEFTPYKLCRGGCVNTDRRECDIGNIDSLRRDGLNAGAFIIETRAGDLPLVCYETGT